MFDCIDVNIPNLALIKIVLANIIHTHIQLFVTQKLPFGPVAERDVGNEPENRKKHQSLNLRSCKLLFLYFYHSSQEKVNNFC